MLGVTPNLPSALKKADIGSAASSADLSVGRNPRELSTNTMPSEDPGYHPL